MELEVYQNDFLNTVTINPQLNLIHLCNDKENEYGQLGVDKGEEFTNHGFGIYLNNPIQEDVLSFNSFIF